MGQRIAALWVNSASAPTAAFTKFLLDNETGVTFDEVKGKASPRIKALMEYFFLETSKAYPSREQYEKAVNVSRLPLKLAIDKYFHDHNVQALVFPPLIMPAPLIGQDAEIDIGGKKFPNFVALGRNALVAEVFCCYALIHKPVR